MLLTKSKIYELRLIKYKKEDFIFHEKSYNFSTRLENAIKIQNKKSIFSVILIAEQYQDFWNLQMIDAVITNCEKMLQICIDRGANDWDWGSGCASYAGNAKFVNFFISKSSPNWDWIITRAIEGKQKKLKIFLQKLK